MKAMVSHFTFESENEPTQILNRKLYAMIIPAIVIMITVHWIYV